MDYEKVAKIIKVVIAVLTALVGTIGGAACIVTGFFAN